MKTSTILFILAFIIGYIAIRFFDSWGQVSMTMDNQPTNALSKFWLQMYDLRVTQELEKPVKHVKSKGRGERIYLEIQQHEESLLFSRSPQAFTYSRDGDTLIIYNTEQYTHILLRQPIPLDQITLHQAKAFVAGFHQEKLSVAVHDGGSLYTNFSNRDNAGIDSVSHLQVYATTGSSVNLNRLTGSTVSATLDNAVLNYGAETKVDSVFAKLHGRSTVSSNNRDAVNQIGHLVVSGNKEYFRKEFIGKAVDVNVRP
ncbi:hypothetical protein H8B06_18560 [Sphingobacterium sp. DN00404]|uniref:Auto-transporter adhesin head GIN domain-containing protein n=1 Tax=Sphingobacterium micropteri TaxID=2763501 RepID=A0ABR7YUI8_9SPHI|nr:hypothetical protein [Sphingobacterium micropteri]MBD1434833.1 hypothetical protein [Sphingobacterium micropteri]